MKRVVIVGSIQLYLKLIFALHLFLTNSEAESSFLYSRHPRSLVSEQRIRNRRNDGIIHFPSTNRPKFSVTRIRPTADSASVFFTRSRSSSITDDVLTSPSTLEQINEPRCKNNEDYCEDAEGYPFRVITTIAANVSSSLDIMEEPAPEISLRSEFSHPVCLSKQKSIYPRLAKNYHDEEMWILNEIEVGKKMIKQRVDVEVCSDQGGGCGIVGEGFSTKCTQKYIYKKLLSVSTKDYSKAVIDIFRFPSCCVCVVHTSSFLS